MIRLVVSGSEIIGVTIHLFAIPTGSSQEVLMATFVPLPNDGAAAFHALE
jgi:hypothetical protein